MRNTLTQSMAWLHTWAGLIVGWLLFVIFVTGALTVFAPEITYWMQPEARPAKAAPAAALEVALQRLEERAAGADSWYVAMPTERAPALEIAWRQRATMEEEMLDPATGEVLAPRATEGGEFFNRVHYELHAGWIGLWLVGLAGVTMLATTVSGIIIHKRIFRDFFTFRPKASRQRAWLDAHNATGVLTLPFLLMIGYTGLTISFMSLMPAPVRFLYAGDSALPRADVVASFDRPRTGEPAPLVPITELLPRAEASFGGDPVWIVHVEHPGDKHAVVEMLRYYDTRVAAVSDHIAFDGATGETLGEQSEWRTSALFWRTLVGLHLAQFGGHSVRWLYFLSGLAGSGMIAAGLLLFSIKRSQGRNGRPRAGPERVADRLNVAFIAGTLVACAAFPWANRLLPVDLAERGGWEAAVFAAAWLGALVHAFLRPPGKAWVEQLGTAAALCLFLPILNGLTTQTHILAAIPRDDWMSVGVDATAFAAGSGLAATVWKLRSRRQDVRAAAPTAGSGTESRSTG